MLKCTLGQPLTRCKYTAKLLDFLMMNRDQEMHLAGCREICIKMKITHTCVCKNIDEQDPVYVRRPHNTSFQTELQSRFKPRRPL